MNQNASSTGGSASSLAPQIQAPRAPRQPSNNRYAGRVDVRHAVRVIVRRIHLRRLAAARLTKSQLERVKAVSSTIECILYRRAASLGEYRDPITLEERVRRAGRALCIEACQREAEREIARRFEAAAALSRESRGALLALQAGPDPAGGGRGARRRRSRSI